MIVTPKTVPEYVYVKKLSLDIINYMVYYYHNMNKKYTKKQIQEFIDYLGLAVKEGYVDESFAHEVIRHKAWGEVEEYMAKGDYYANK